MSAFTVEVFYDESCDRWGAVCSALGIVTEDDTYESVMKNVLMLAPMMFSDNNLPGNVEDMRLSFVNVCVCHPESTPA
ncbi:MAG: DUF1902 domain-containing protein [Burkholderiaceae bacterium]|nr:DUF1902 domain-containing protein [Burkholderiaceae bacterium]